MQLVTASARPLLYLALAGTLAACGLFSSPAPEETPSAEAPAEESEDPAANLPKCRPAGTEPTRGPILYKAGETTPGGWAVTSIDDANLEFVRIGFQKDATETMIEIAYNEGEEGDWATASYRLMPAPDHEPPGDLLEEVMASLKTWQSSHGDDPFVKKREGVEDPFDGLPPCGPDGKPM